MWRAATRFWPLLREAKSYICMIPKGVAYRNSENENDFFWDVRGPKYKTIVKPQKLGDNWMEVDVPGHGTKYLPIKGYFEEAVPSIRVKFKQTDVLDYFSFKGLREPSPRPPSSA